MGTDTYDNEFAAGNTVEQFDREYRFDELVPVSYFESLFKDIRPFGVSRLIAFHPDMSIYYATDDSGVELDVYRTAVKDENGLKGCFAWQVSDTEVLTTIAHDFDTIAYLLVSFNPEVSDKKDFSINFGRFVCRVIEQLVICTYKNLLTSGIHTRVVRDSYEEIKHKSDLLELSEKKYRLLAESLEEEVNKKAQEIKDAQAQLMHQEKLASIGHLAAGVAHEINNPMGFISSNLQTLKDYFNDVTEMIRGYRSEMSDSDITTSESVLKLEQDLDIDYLLEDIPNLLSESLDGTDRINKIVTDLKDFAHPGEEQPCYADLNNCIESTMNIVWNELKYKATVSKQFGSIPQLYCYPRQLNQVIMNLLVNAAHAIKTTGEITITTKEVGDSVEMTVSDTGVGIPDEVLPKIFDPFFTTKEVGKGTGLGLNLVYNIIKKHNGTITAQSKQGVGTTFSIFLPVNNDL